MKDLLNWIPDGQRTCTTLVKIFGTESEDSSIELPLNEQESVAVGEPNSFHTENDSIANELAYPTSTCFISSNTKYCHFGITSCWWSCGRVVRSHHYWPCKSNSSGDTQHGRSQHSNSRLSDFMWICHLLKKKTPHPKLSYYFDIYKFLKMPVFFI